MAPILISFSRSVVSDQYSTSCGSPNVCYGSCVDGSPLARVNLTFVQIGRVQSCVRPVDAAYVAAGPNAIRGSGPNHKRALVKRPDPNGFSRPSVRPILHYLTFTLPNSSPPMSQLHSWAAPFLVVALTTRWHIAMPLGGSRPPHQKQTFFDCRANVRFRG